jgi:hypothetical protein
VVGNASAVEPPAPWQHQTIGYDLPAGSADYDPVTRSITITADGHDIWDDADDFHYVYQQWSGDGEFICRVDSFPLGNNGWQKAGIMVRQDLDDTSKYVFQCITGTFGGGASFQWRDTKGDAGTLGNNDSPTTVTEPEYIRLVRSGDVFSGYLSEDGSNWTQLGTDHTSVFTDPLWIGLAVTSHSAGNLVTATIDSVGGDVSFGPWPYASNPSPANGSAINGFPYPPDYIYAVMNFEAGDFAVKHTGYFSDNRNDVVNRIEDANLGQPHPDYPTVYFVGVPFPDYTRHTDSLVRGTWYYWCVDETDSNNVVWQGDIWRFYVYFETASNPNPRDGQRLISTTPTLTWDPGGVPDFSFPHEHDVYFGTSFDDVNNADTSEPNNFMGTQPYDDEMWDPNADGGLPPLDFETSYYWRIDEVHGRESPLPGTVLKGDVWTFTTRARVVKFFVDIDAAGANDGPSWADACNYLQDALFAALSGDEIWVAEGIYRPNQGVGITPSDRMATFQLINGVAIKGGYAGFGEPDPNARDIDAYETILSGYICVGEICGNSCHVVTGSGTDETAVLDGFTITGGNADCWYEDDVGGGIYNDSGSPTISNCTFAGNTAFIAGGGMYNIEGSPTLTNCAFIRNGVVEHLWDGMPSYGGGISSGWGEPKLTNCIFIGNMSISGGGGMDNYGGSPTLTNCRFSGNSVIWGGTGGGMYSAQSTANLNNCIFVGNSAGDHGGGMHTWKDGSRLTNCTFSANSAARYGGDDVGGGMHNDDSSVILTNCIFRGNSDSGGVDESAQIHGGSPVVNYCCIQGWSGSLGGTGNTGADPMFVREPNDGGDGWCDDIGTPEVDEGVNDDFGDVHLLPSSPCIETGDPNFIAGPNDVDMDGQLRVVGGCVDIGADEFVYIGDFDFDGLVAMADVGFFVSHWLDTGCSDWAGDKGKWCYGTDVNKDGGIDWHDFALLAANWLAGL